MITEVRNLRRKYAARWIGERPIPIGGVARDRRLLLVVLDPTEVGSVLVVGSSVAARQALASIDVDVAGTNPHNNEVTVCSRVLEADSLPKSRWDTVIINSPGADLRERLRAVRPACRPSGRLLVLERGPRSAHPGHAVTLAELGAQVEVWARRHNCAWSVRLSP